MIDLPLHHLDRWLRKWVQCPICKAVLRKDGAANHFYLKGKKDPEHYQWAQENLVAKYLVAKDPTQKCIERECNGLRVAKGRCIHHYKRNYDAVSKSRVAVS